MGPLASILHSCRRVAKHTRHKTLRSDQRESHYDAKQDTLRPIGRQAACGQRCSAPLKRLKLDKQNHVTNSLLRLDCTNRDIAGSTLAAQLYGRPRNQC